MDLLNIKLTKETTQRDTLDNDLSIVYVRDFDDEYHEDIEVDNGIVQQARNIRRRYQNPSEYAYANIALNEYLDLLSEKYGGPAKFKLALDLGIVTEYLPPIPKMKGNARINSLMASGSVISNRPGDIRVKEGVEIDDLVDLLEPQDVDGTFEEVYSRSSDEYMEYIEVTQELEAHKMMINKDKMNSISIYRNTSNFEDLMNIFNIKGTSNDPDLVPGNGVRPDLLRLSTVVDANRMEKIINPDSGGNELTTDTITGTLISKSTAEKMGMAQMFANNGWNSIVAANIINDPRVIKSMELEEEIKQKKSEQMSDASAYIDEVLRSNGMVGGASMADIFGGE